MHTYICWNILISQITGGKSPFFFSRWPPLPFRSSISRDRWKKPPSFLSRDPSNIGKMAATLVASVPQRPVQFSFLPFPVLLFSSPHPRPPRRGSNIDSDISTGILFSTSLLAPFLYFSLSGGQDARHATSLPLPLRKEGHNSPSRKRSTSSSIHPGFSNHNLTYYLKILFENLYINYV